MTVDANGNADSYFDYFPYGQLMDGRSLTTSADGRYKYTGKERDVETNYDYFWARSYDARIGRWLRRDPLEFLTPGVSGYSYVDNNPIRFVDPLGLVGGDTAKTNQIPLPITPLPPVPPEIGKSTPLPLPPPSPPARSDATGVVTGNTSVSTSTARASDTFDFMGSVAFGAGVAETSIYNRLTLIGRDLKFHQVGRGLNQYSGSASDALRVSKYFSHVGTALYVTQFGIAGYDLIFNNRWDRFGKYSLDLGLDFPGLFGPYGFGLSLYLRGAESERERREEELQEILGNGEDVKMQMWIWSNQGADRIFGK